MGGGANSGFPKSICNLGRPKRRYAVKGCKKRAIAFVNDKPFCKKHYGVTIL